MVSEACCNRDRTQAVFPDPVIPAIIEVKGCLKRNRWHFCENIGTVWNGVRPALRCLDITCLCILSFRLKDFSQTEQNQLMSTPEEQNVDWERGRMLRIYIGFQAIKSIVFLHHHHHRHHISIVSLLLLISIVFSPPPPHFYCFPSSSSFLLFFLLIISIVSVLLLISIVFPSSSSFYCFLSLAHPFPFFFLHEIL